MAKSFIINGGKPLCGTVTVSGSKNAALPLVFASLALNGVSVLSGVPDISDVRAAVELVSSFGARVSRAGSTLTIDARSVSYVVPDKRLTERIRASTYLIGACLARFGRAPLPECGGCDFSARPIDMHVAAAEALGAERRGTELHAPRLVGADVHLRYPSVGASVNAALAAVGARGTTRIFNCAREPHVAALFDFLASAGVVVRRLDGYVEIEGGAEHGGFATVIPDMIEAGTYVVASLMTSSPFLVRGANVGELEALLRPLAAGGAAFSITREGITLCGSITAPVSIKAEPYPGFPTDMQPQFAALLAVGAGGTVSDAVFPSRFGYLAELARFGVRYELVGSEARIAPSELRPARAAALDIRGGAAVLVAALAAHGTSVISSAELIERGYERVAEKLTALGADIRSVENDDI